MFLLNNSGTHRLGLRESPATYPNVRGVVFLVESPSNTLAGYVCKPFCHRCTWETTNQLVLKNIDMSSYNIGHAFPNHVHIPSNLQGHMGYSWQ